MAELLTKYFCMFPVTDYLFIEGWAGIGTGVSVVEDQGSATAGAQHAARLPAGKTSVGGLKTDDLDDTGILRSTVYMKFGQRDTYLNQNPEHPFLRFYDNGGANQVAALIYKGIGINDNQVGVRDVAGGFVALDSGPFFAGIWNRWDCIWRHSDSTAMFVYKNGVFQGSTGGGKDFFTTSGPVQLQPQGQIATVLGPSGITHCGFLAHFTDVVVAAAPPYAKYLFRPYLKYGTIGDSNETGGPSDELFAGDLRYVWDNAPVPFATLRTSGVGDTKAFACGCNLDQDRCGPAGRFAAGTVAVAFEGCMWHDFSTKGGNDNDPHLLVGKANADFDTFTIVEQDTGRGANVKTQRLLLPGDTGFPEIDEYAMLGALNRQTVGIGKLNVEELCASYLVVHPAPPLTQVRVLGETTGLGDVGAPA